MGRGRKGSGVTRFTIMKAGVHYVLKTCPRCGDEWYARRKQNRCTLCGAGLVMRTPQNADMNWDELKPDISTREHRKFLRAAQIVISNAER